jgi:hypothetical protein
MEPEIGFPEAFGQKTWKKNRQFAQRGQLGYKKIEHRWKRKSEI